MLDTQNHDDFSQFGYDQQAICFSADLFSIPVSTGTFQYEESSNKATMMAGQPVTPYLMASRIRLFGRWRYVCKLKMLLKES